MKTKDELEAVIVESDRKIKELEAAERSHEKARVSNKKEFLRLSAERTKLEVIKDDMDGLQAKVDVNAEKCLVEMKRLSELGMLLSTKETELADLEKKTRASCKRKENAATKALSDAEAFKEEAESYKAKYEHKYAKLKAAIDG